MNVRVTALAPPAIGLLLALSATAQAQDHSQHQVPTSTTQDHAQHEAKPKPAATHEEPLTPIPELTDDDRAAAFPDIGDHAAHDNSIQHYVLLDRLEASNADHGNGLQWKGQGWIGTDLNKLRLRSEGERTEARTERADLEVLYGRSVARWWDVVAGIRHDFKPGDSQDYAAFGVMGVAPYKFEVEATVYIGRSGQTAARLEAEYDTLLTNRLILQWQAEAELYGQGDAPRGIGPGLNRVEGGLRLRYEFTRQFAPYIGIAWERAYGDAAKFRRNEDASIEDTRFVIGLRLWF